MNDRRYLMKLLVDQDPIAYEELPNADERRQLRERIVATPRPGARGRETLDRRLFRPGWQWAPRAAAVLVVGVLLALFGVPRLMGGAGSSSAVATPPLIVQPGAGEPADPAMLRELADAASTAADPEGHRTTVSWDLSTAVSEGRGKSEILASRRDVWIQPQQVVTCDSESLPVDVLLGPEQRAEDVPACDRVETHGAGTFHVPTLPDAQTSSNGLIATLATNPEVDDVTEVVTAFLDAAGVRPLAPDETSALLTFLADSQGIVDYGRVDDRAGRQGQAFGFPIVGHGLPMQQLLVFDSRSGQLLAEETLLTEDAGKLNVQVPSTIGYTLYFVSQQASPQ